MERADDPVREGHRNPVYRRVRECIVYRADRVRPGGSLAVRHQLDWVGKAVEAVSDQSLEVYFREHIFAPLGMSDTGFLIAPRRRPGSRRCSAATRMGR